MTRTDPLVVRVKRNSLDDGPGIRTTVFFKGCPLSCRWCHNPEARSIEPEISHDTGLCVGCGTCETVCSKGAVGKDKQGFVDRAVCDLCFECVETCPSRALTRVGVAMSVDAIMAEIEKDLPFFRISGGGVTLSGGEPTLFMDFCSELTERCVARGVPVLLETCGQFDFDDFHKKLYRHLDAVYYDIKLYDARSHRDFCGVGNERILENFRRLAEPALKGGPPVLPRIPLVPGATDTDENLSGIADFLRGLGVRCAALLPYNPTWHGKAERLGRSPEFAAEKWMSPEQIGRCRSFFEGFRLVD